MKNHFKNIFLFIAFLLAGFSSYAQLYPVQLTPVFNSPYSVKISDYATSMDTKMQLLINPTDISINNRQVRLKLSIQGNGINAQSSAFIQGQNPIFINGGELQTITNVDIAALFRLENLEGISAVQYANPLPEGMYNFCFEMYDFVTNQKISQKSCSMLYLILNDPPLLNTPQRNEQIAASDFPNILFTWTPRQINATNVSYTIELKELLDPNLDPQYGFLMAPLLYQETDLHSTALVYDLGKPNLVPGKRYAWRVRAISTSGLSENSVFKNDGYSEVFSFKYTGYCLAPTFLLSEAQGPRSVKITWQGVPDHTRYQLQYKKQDVANAQWFSVYSQNTQSLLTDLEVGVTYQFRVGSSCDPATDGRQSFTYSGINTFATPTQTNGVSAYNCGITPKISIQNQTPIINLIESETFTAGDFPVKILEISGSNGLYSGKGSIVVPYLGLSIVGVTFENITINTDYQLIKGVVQTSYNPDWKNVVGIDPLVEEIFGPQTGTETVDTNIETSTDDTATTGSINGTNTNNNAGSNTGTTTNPIVATGPNSTGTIDAGTNTNTGIVTSAGNNSDNSTTSSNGTNTSGSDYFIEYKGKKYYAGGKIPIPYNRNLLASNRFKMGGLEKETNVKYELSYQSERGILANNVGGNNYLKKIESKTEADYDFSFDNTLKYQLKSIADTDKKPSLSNEINLVLKTFELASLKAIDNSNPKRFASNGETLYYVNTAIVPYKYTKFQIAYTPNLSIDEIPKDKIKWKFNDIDVESKNGIKDFSEKITNGKDIKAVVLAGAPNLIKKTANVEWVQGYSRQYEVVPPVVKNALSELSKYVNNIGTVLRKLDNTGKLVFNISFQGQESLEEDNSTRFYNVKRDGGFGGSIDLEFKGFTYGADLKIAVAQLYLKPILSLSANGKMQYIKRNDQKTFTELGTVMTFGLQADLKAGGEIGLDIKAIKINAEPYAGISSWGQITYQNNTKTIEGSLGIGKPYVGIKGEVLFAGYDILPPGDFRQTWEEIKLELPFKYELSK
jgi:hypothetical protein